MRHSALLFLLLALTLVPASSAAAPRYSSAFQSHQIPFFGSEVLPADFDRDGRMDLAVVSTGGIVLLQGLAGGTFLRADTLAITGRSRGAVADLDEFRHGSP